MQKRENNRKWAIPFKEFNPGGGKKTRKEEELERNNYSKPLSEGIWSRSRACLTTTTWTLSAWTRTQTLPSGQEAIVRCLIDRGANVNAKKTNGFTPLLAAVQEGHLAVVSILIDKGARLEEKENQDFTALIMASEKGQTAIARLLIDKEARLEDKQNDGYTALLVATFKDCSSLVSLLLERGCLMGRQPMMAAIASTLPRPGK